MRKTLCLALLCLLTVLPVAAQTTMPKPDAPAPGEWRTYAQPAGGFAVTSPAPFSGKVENEISNSIEGHAFKLKLRLFHAHLKTSSDPSTPIVYLVGTLDFVEGFPEAEFSSGYQESFLDGISRGFAAGANGNVLKQGTINYGEHPGRFARLLVGGPDNKRLFMSIRAYLIGRRTYFMQVVSDESRAEDPSIARFLDSFRLTTDEEKKRFGTTNTDEMIAGNEEIASAKVKSLAAPHPDAPGDTRPPKTVEIAPPVVIVRRAEGVLRGNASNRVTPEYPEEARAARIQGDVVCEILIDEEGKVVEAKILSGPPELHTAALAAVRQWTFKPTLLNGKPVKVSGVITFRFNLGK